MLLLPDITGEPLNRIVAFDPGTNRLGVAVLDYNKEQGTHFVEHAATFFIGNLYKQYPVVIETYGERVAKQYAARCAVQKVLEAWNPSVVASESPYMGSFPQAYMALVECIDAIRRACKAFNPYQPLITIDPATVKKSIGVSGKSGDKEAIRNALANRKSLTFDVGVSLDKLDEHAVDAIAVGIAATLQSLR